MSIARASAVDAASQVAVIAMSLAAGKHALFDGIDALKIFGFQGRPEVTEKNGTVEIKANGFSFSFKNAKTSWNDKELRVVID